LPSLDQLRNEAFADAVERAMTPIPLTTIRERLRARVVIKDGRQLEFQPAEVDLYGNQLVGRDSQDAPVRIALGTIQTVWYRRPLVWRSVTLWGSATIGGALLGSGQNLEGVLLGALLGAGGGALTSWLLRDWRAMYEWKQLYDSGPPSR
jgi:hypothetical protein